MRNSTFSSKISQPSLQTCTFGRQELSYIGGFALISKQLRNVCRLISSQRPDTKRKLSMGPRKISGRTEFGVSLWMLTFTQRHRDAEMSLVRTWGLSHFMYGYYQERKLSGLLYSEHVNIVSEYNWSIILSGVWEGYSPNSLQLRNQTHILNKRIQLPIHLTVPFMRLAQLLMNLTLIFISLAPQGSLPSYKLP